MGWPLPTVADVLHARAALAPYLRPTPTLEPPALSAALGCQAFVKCENLNSTGAFKVRGGLYLLSRLSAEQRARDVLAASTGNPAQSVAYAARLFKARVIIYMPEAANPLKVKATRAWGAEVVLTGRDYDEARMVAESHASREGLRYIHSADESLLIAGVATYALELLEVAPVWTPCSYPSGAAAGPWAPRSWRGRSTPQFASSACRRKGRLRSTARGRPGGGSSPRGQRPSPRDWRRGSRSRFPWSTCRGWSTRSCSLTTLSYPPRSACCWRRRSRSPRARGAAAVAGAYQRARRWPASASA